MFGRFKRKLPLQPSVGPESKLWIENALDWLITIFSFQKIKDEPFLLPGDASLSINNLSDPAQLQTLLNNICHRWDFAPNSIVIAVFDDLMSKQWTTPLIPSFNSRPIKGVFEQKGIGAGATYQVHLPKSSFNDPELLVAMLVHELSNLKMVAGGLVDENDAHKGALADMTSIYLGFGIFAANTCQREQGYWVTNNSYLSNEFISYANAALCYMTGYDPDRIIGCLNVNTRELFEQNFNYLKTTGDTILTKEQTAKSDAIFHAELEIATGFRDRAFDRVLEGCKKLQSLGIDNYIVQNNIGYALLSKKEYRAAIEAFDTATEMNPFFDYSFNNRGYCRLQLGELEQGFVDVNTSWEMNPDNSFNWRNLAVYYLLTNDYNRALEFMEKAEKLNPETEMINFYLGLVHERMGDTEKAKMYYARSRERNEYNDSVFVSLL